MKHGKLKAGVAALLAVVVIASGAFVGWSAAYFTDTKDVNKTFTFGTVEIILEEPDFPDDPPPSVPNGKTPKNPIIYNNGTERCVAFATITVPVDEFTPINSDGSKGIPGTYPVYLLKANGNTEDGNTFGSGWLLLNTNEADGNVVYTLGYQSVLPPSSKQVSNPADYEQLDSKTNPVFDYIQLQNFLEGTLQEHYQILVDAYGIQPTSDDGTLTEAQLQELWNSYGSQAK